MRIHTNAGMEAAMASSVWPPYHAYVTAVVGFRAAIGRRDHVSYSIFRIHVYSH